ncbi:unnamed protein product [Moneuplotes crassus]|uniref:LsmAD domain-containing protein n=1 Tax=Euplotes crassus TaxID=5936 RepID=A0AAD1XA23_EUPCR|nr:unnamed protein product [Moneuplotes crassus]
MSTKGGKFFKPSQTDATKKETKGKERDLVKFSMGGNSTKLQFTDDGTTYNQFTKESSFKDSYYTTEVDESKFNDEQKKKAALIEKQINNEKKGIKNNDLENDDEEMDNSRPPKTQSYDQFIKENNVVDVMELERNLSAASTDLKNQTTDIELMKKESQKSINDFEIEEMGGNASIPINNTEEKDDQTPKMKLHSREFTPKSSKPDQSSSKSIDEFEITTGSAPEKKTTAPKSNLKLKPTTRTFKPSGSTLSKPSKPFIPSSNLSQSTATPYRPPLSQPPVQNYPPATLPQAAAPKTFYPKGNESFKRPSQSLSSYTGGVTPSAVDQNVYQQTQGIHASQRQIKISRYYSLKQQVSMEEFFCFETFYNESKRNGFVESIQKAKEFQMNKNNQNNQNQNQYQNNSYSGYPRGSQAASYQNGADYNNRGGTHGRVY